MYFQQIFLIISEVHKGPCCVFVGIGDRICYNGDCTLTSVIGRFNQPQKLGNRLPRYRVNDIPQVSQLRFISSVCNSGVELLISRAGISFLDTVLN